MWYVTDVCFIIGFGLRRASYKRPLLSGSVSVAVSVRRADYRQQQSAGQLWVAASPLELSLTVASQVAYRLVARSLTSVAVAINRLVDVRSNEFFKFIESKSTRGHSLKLCYTDS